MGITTKDLAKICGVSRTTIHRALSGEGRIHPDTKEMILRVAKEQGYQPDLLARGLVKGKTSNIGIVVLDVKNRYFAEMISAIGAEVNKRGYCMNIMLHGDNPDLEREQIMRLSAYRMDGIILSSVNKGNDYVEFLKNLNIPIITVDNRIDEQIPFVGIDQKNAMKDSVMNVLEKGYRKLVYVCPPMQLVENQNMYVHEERRKGFEEAVADKPELQIEYLTDWNYLNDIETQIDPQKRTAFVCVADSFALDIMKKLQLAGKKAPGDYGITGFDNIDTLDYLEPRLTTVSNAADSVAVAAAELLFQMIDDKEYTSCCKILPYQIISGNTL